MGKSKYRKKAAVFIEEAKKTQEPYAELGEYAQGEEGLLLSDRYEQSDLYQDMLGAGNQLATDFQGGGGFRTTAISEGYAGQLSLNRHQMTSQFSGYADMGQEAAENIGNIGLTGAKIHNAMRQNERGSTFRMVQSIARGVYGGMGLPPMGGGQPSAMPNDGSGYQQSGGFENRTTSSGPAWMQGVGMGTAT